MDEDRVAEIIEKNPKIDRAAVERSQEAAKRLADVGIKVGGYRLKPALGGATTRNSAQTLRGRGRD